MTYGRSAFKALGKFNLDVARWPELAAERGAWRDYLLVDAAGCTHRCTGCTRHALVQDRPPPLCQV